GRAPLRLVRRDRAGAHGLRDGAVRRAARPRGRGPVVAAAWGAGGGDPAMTWSEATLLAAVLLLLRLCAVCVVAGRLARQHRHVGEQADERDAPLARDLAESELSRTMREALSDDEEVAQMRANPAGRELVDALVAAWYRVQLARRFHNEAVAQTQRVRRKTLV